MVLGPKHRNKNKVNKVRKTRRTLKNKNVKNVFTVVGTNANGILGKRDSLFQIMDQLKPSVLFLQESKVGRKGQIKIPDYEIFEFVRSKANGGSLLTAAHSNLHPVLISSEECESEILVIQAKFGKYDCRFINAYGPQEYASLEDKISFYARLDQEVKNAKLFNCLFCLEMDANAKVGSEIIKNDPHKMSGNGELFLDFIARNNLIIGNSTDLCEGSITRKRVTVNGTEESILDYFVFCQELFLLLNSMKVDENQTYVLTKYSKKKGQTVVTKSDHNLLYCEFRQPWNDKICLEKKRLEIFNYRDKTGIKQFNQLTSSNSLSKCFKSGDKLKESKAWLKEFQNILHRSFKKIRITTPRPNRDIISQMREKATLMNKLENLEFCLKYSKKDNSEIIISKMILIKSEIEDVEVFISNLISKQNAKKIKEHFVSLSENGAFGSQNMWRLKRKLNFKETDVPTAKTDTAGNLITSRQGLLNLYKNTYIERLAPKEALKDYQSLQLMKEALFGMRYEIASQNKSANWTAAQVEKVCKTLHNSKARDELGLVYEMFKPPFAGQDIYHSLAKMFNGMKVALEVPSFLQEMSITSFYKLRGLKSDLSNDRGCLT